MIESNPRRALPLTLLVAVYLGGCRDATSDAQRGNRVESPATTSQPTPATSEQHNGGPPSSAEPRQLPPNSASSANSGEATASSTEKHTAAAYPVRWADWLELKSIGELEQRLQAPYDDGFGDLELGSEMLHPTTCAQWSELHARGAEPPTTLAVQGDNTARVRCGALSLVKRASPSSKSHVGNLPRNQQLLSLLPASVASGLGPEREQARAQATRAGKTLKDFVPTASMKRALRRKDGVEIREGRGEAVTLVYPEVWGDFNGDGTEDVVMSVTSVDPESGDSEARLIILTRATVTESLHELD